MNRSLKYIRPAEARTSLHIGSLIKVFDVCLPTRCIPDCVLGFKETLILTMCSQIDLVLSVGPGNTSSRKYTPSPTPNPEIPLHVKRLIWLTEVLWMETLDISVDFFFFFFFFFFLHSHYLILYQRKKPNFP